MNMLLKLKITLILLIQVLPSINSEDMPSIQFNVLFQTNCPDLILYAENIHQIEKDTQTNIQLIQMVRISGGVDKIQEAHKRVSQLNVNFTQEKPKALKTTKIEDLHTKIQETQNIFERKFLELKNAMDSNKMDIQAKLSENSQNMTSLVQEEKQEVIKNIKNELQVLQTEIDGARNISEIQFQNMTNLVQEVKEDVIKNIQNMTNAMTSNEFKAEANNTKFQEIEENEDIMSDMELENFFKSEEYAKRLEWDGDHALHTACLMGRLDVVKKLIKNGVDVNIKGDGNYSPIMYASWYGHKAIVEYLISKNADVHVKGYGNDTALSLARGTDKDEIIKILKNHGATT